MRAEQGNDLLQAGLSIAVAENPQADHGEAASRAKTGCPYAAISDSLNVISKTLRLFWIGVNG
jgi:hypothetical protein